MPKCSVRGCKKQSAVMWLLIEGQPALCSYHYERPPSEYKYLVEAAHELSDAEADFLLGINVL